MAIPCCATLCAVKTENKLWPPCCCSIVGLPSSRPLYIHDRLGSFPQWFTMLYIRHFREWEWQQDQDHSHHSSAAITVLNDGRTTHFSSMVQSCLTYLNYRMIQIMRQLLHSSLEMFSGVYRAVKNWTFWAFFDVLQSAQRISNQLYWNLLTHYTPVRAAAGSHEMKEVIVLPVFSRL